MSEDSPAVSAAIIRKYADLREEYLHGNTDFNGAQTNNQERWLMCEIQGLRKAAELIDSPTTQDSALGLPSRHWDTWMEMVEKIRSEAK